MSMASQISSLAARVGLEFKSVRSEIVARTPKVSVGTTAPSSPAVNDLWVDTN